jgi:hypothetical protein
MVRMIVIVALGAFYLGCGDGVGNAGDVVGGPCHDDRDCARGSFCATGGDFPSGTCTVACNDDRDCPSSTACIDKQGGICLLLCNFDADCRHGYQCNDESRRGASGSATVCID